MVPISSAHSRAVGPPPGARAVGNAARGPGRRARRRAEGLGGRYVKYRSQTYTQAIAVLSRVTRMP